MAGSKSNALETALLDHRYGGPDYVRPATVWLALFTAGPVDAGTGTEVSTGDWTNYARFEITNNDTNFPAATSPGGVGTKSNGTDFDFGTAATGGDVSLSGWGFFDDAVAGDLMDWGTFDSPVVVQDGDPVIVLTGALVITED